MKINAPPDHGEARQGDVIQGPDGGFWLVSEPVEDDSSTPRYLPRNGSVPVV